MWLGEIAEARSGEDKSASGPSKSSNSKDKPPPGLETRCVDNGDGTYTLGWRAEVSGHYQMHVKIDGAHVLGSPAHLTMLGASPADTAGMLASAAGADCART